MLIHVANKFSVPCYMQSPESLSNKAFRALYMNDENSDVPFEMRYENLIFDIQMFRLEI